MKFLKVIGKYYVVSLLLSLKIMKNLYDFKSKSLVIHLYPTSIRMMIIMGQYLLQQDKMTILKFFFVGSETRA